MSTVIARLTAALAGRSRVQRALGAGGVAAIQRAHDVLHAPSRIARLYLIGYIAA